MDYKTGLKKPVLRGWIHTVAAPLSLVASIILVILAPTPLTRIGSLIYLVASLLLFGMSAVYHMGWWSQKVDALLRRFDHANIFLLIAGTYTPIAIALLPAPKATVLLSVVWTGAIAGIVGHMVWITAPRWVYTPIYIILGWVALAYLSDMWTIGGPAVVLLLIAGGLCYTIGALIYALKWPNPSPKIFGFHEIFHAGTVAGWTCHCVAAYISVLAAA
ncbi:MAG: hemolysin III family protein [Actinomycetaceae bacterium]|nr:hemolysin III family protein [Actinomycetaceae bacterium]